MQRILKTSVQQLQIKQKQYLLKQSVTRAFMFLILKQLRTLRMKMVFHFLLIVHLHHHMVRIQSNLVRTLSSILLQNGLVDMVRQSVELLLMREI